MLPVPLKRLMMAAFLTAGALLVPATVRGQQDPYSRFDGLRAVAQYRAAETLARQQKEYFEKTAPHEIPSIARWARNLGYIYLDEGRYDEAAPQFTRALELAQEHSKIWPPEIYDLTAYQIALADLHMERSRYDLAEPLVKAALEYRRKGRLVDPQVEIAALQRAARILRSQGQNELAAHAEKYAANRPQDEKTRREVNTAAVSESLDQYGRLLLETGKYAAAEKAFSESLELREDLWGPLQKDVASSMDQLGRLYLVIGQYTKAEARLKKAVSIREAVLEKDHTATAAALVNLGAFYLRLGRTADADSTLTRAIDIYARRQWLGHPDAALAQFTLGTLYAQRGRFAEADKLYRRSLSVRQKVYSPQHKNLAQSFDGLARLHVQHGRADEAIKLAEDSLALREKIYGKEHIEVAAAAERLAEVRQALGERDAAGELLSRSAAIRRQALGDRHPDVAQSLVALARLRAEQNKNDEARQGLLDALSIQREKLGASHEETIAAMLELAALELGEGKREETKKLLGEASQAANEAAPSPQTTSRLKSLQAELAWQEEDHKQALLYLEQAIQKAEEQRAFAAGGEQEQGALFASFAKLYHRLVAWQFELGNIAEAFAAMERSRARSLLDQMSLHGADPLSGVAAMEREALSRRHVQSQLRLAGLTRQIQLLSQSPGQSAEEFQLQRARLVEGLKSAQAQVLEAYRALRSASRTFVLAGQEGAPVATLAETQQFAEQHQAALVSFFLTADDLYRVVIAPGAAPRLDRVELAADAAAAFGVEPGRVSADKLWSMCRLDSKELSQWLADASGTQKAQAHLAMLWQVLFPAALREGLTSDQLRLMVVAPDGPLLRLPLETLVVEPGDDPKYLLDVGPPTIYVPSATVLAQLAGRQRSKGAAEPVLSVGDPAYQAADAAAANAVALISPGTRFATLAGGLTRLPYTAWETKWVAEVFARHGAPAVTLTQQAATERACREKLTGREIIHLACHGLCDEASGNLFGSLALAPNPRGEVDPADDGFLTLAEIYELNLPGNELAILSACQTNAGPLTRGEGVWALSRGFLVAGSRRVVASNWLVDDEAGASLVSYFCAGIAESRGTGTVDYAQALLKAKRAVRQQEKWSAPYYWAGLVLVGPN